MQFANENEKENSKLHGDIGLRRKNILLHIADKNYGNATLTTMVRIAIDKFIENETKDEV